MANTHSMDSAWKPVKIGAGGWLTGMDVAPDGSRIVRTDTYGAYLWDGAKWAQLVTSVSMPANVQGASGVYEIRFAPSNSNIMYMQLDGYVYKSTNKGGSWTETAFAKVAQDPNGQNRMDGQKMAVDPTNPDVVFAGTQKDGLFVTRDGGQSWQKVAAVPAAAGVDGRNDSGLTGIVFDASAGATAGKTNVIYAATAGNGVYRSSDAGVTWSALSGGPRDVSHAAVGRDGVYYATGNTDDAVWKFAGGVWSQLPAPRGAHSVAVDPFNPAHVVLTNDGGSLAHSRDGGRTWDDGWTKTKLEASADVPWLENSGGYMSSGALAFDPHTAGKVWQSAGVGVWHAQVPQTLGWWTTLEWTSLSAGIEQLVANEVIAPKGGDPVFASWDRPFFAMADVDSYASSYGGGHFSMGWSIDYASSDPRFIVGLSDWYGTEESGFSADGGKTWSKFAGLPSFAQSSIGGSIAASSSTNFVWAPANRHSPAYTKDGGVTWTNVSLPGSTGDWGSFHFAHYLNRTTVAADRVLENTFYLYDVATGLHVSRDGGASWTLVHKGQITDWSYYSAKIEAVPGSPGELFFTGGPVDNGDNSLPSDQGFMHSTDGGATWTAVPGVKEVGTFGFGAPATAGGPASVYMVGYVNGDYGIWQSTDDARSWTQIGEHPMGSLDTIKTISGDMDVYGRVYVGFGGSGFAYVDVAGSAPTVSPPPPLPPAPTTPTQLVAITAVDDNVAPGTSNVANGGTTNDPTPTLRGTMSALLGSGQALAVYRDGEKVGQLTPSGTTWSFTDPGARDGLHSYTAQVEHTAGLKGSPSASFALTVDTIAPGQRAEITSALDDVGTATGLLANGATTDDTALQLRGTLSAPLAGGEVLVVLRDGAVVGEAVVSGGTWSFNDRDVAGGGHSYTARVEDKAGNVGSASNPFAVNVQVESLLFGTAGNDRVVGSIASDIISGLPRGTADTKLGKGTTDTLTGNGGADVFVLGDARGRFYDDGRSNSNGKTDFATITDFLNGDKVQLSGNMSQYFQETQTINGVRGAAIFHDSNANGRFDGKDELIGFVQNQAPLDASNFIFV